MIIHVHSKRIFFYIFLLLLVSISCKKSEPYTGLLPEEALSTFQLDSRFKVELIASEPLISDPVDMEIDEYGRLYVVEMHGYPLDVSPSGRIKLLSDTDGDGRMDKSIIFADSLVLPTGVMRWKNGILVTVPRKLLYLEDTNGDGRADLKEIMLDGFALSNPQHNTNNPLFGLDNWIYLAHKEPVTTNFFPDKFGGKGDEIYYPSKPDGPRLPKNANNRNVRFRPDNHELEMLSSRTQFGHTFDRWGNHFFNNYDNHIYQEIIAARYLQRNPALLISDATKSLSDHGNIGEIFPVTKDPETHQLRTEVASFADVSGITSYQGGLFPADFNDVIFTAESVHNLIHADRLKEDGVSFIASRYRPRTEFLTSTDAWFRPVNMYIGPDGALYVVDYYREIIEHPEWLWPSEEELRNSEKEFYNGLTKGRIYRITPTGAKPATWTKGLQLGKATNDDLVKKLADPNIWWRRNAQRLLLDRDDKQIIPELVQMAQNTTSALGRLHALWTLEGMNSLRPELIRKVLQDPVPEIRENAIKLAELHLADTPSLADALLAMQSDTYAKVRYQLLCTLGFIDTPQANQVRKELLFQDIEKEWIQIAALSVPTSQNTALLEMVISSFEPAYASLVRRLSAIVGVSQQPEKIHQLFQKVTTPTSGNHIAWQVPVLEGLAQGLENRDATSLVFQADQNLLVQAFFDHPSDSIRQASLQVLKVTGLPEGSQIQTGMQRAVQMTGNQELSPERRAGALEFIALGSPATHASLLKRLIVSNEPATVQIAALHALSVIPGTTVSEFVLKQWPILTPTVRSAALNTFMKGSFNPEGTAVEGSLDLDRIKLLLAAMESGEIQPNSLDGGIQWRLISLSNESLRNQALRLLRPGNERGQGANKQYVLDVKKETGNPEKGRTVFMVNCIMCHQMGNEGGVPFGPDLATVRSWEEATLIGNIVDPDMAIANGYDLWMAELKSGEVIQGVLVTESANAVTLLNQQLKETTIARKRIRSLKAMQQSAMPADLRDKISPQEMADLIAYIQNVN
jgi:putative membrane-bound dehydrogenase-like protein